MNADHRRTSGSRRRAASDRQLSERRLDVELEHTFPASDAIPWIHDVETEEPPARPEPGRGEPLYLEDFSPGRRFVTGSAAVGAEDIKAFAARFDPQPFHLDETAAADSVFGGLAASGWHTAALSMRLLVDSLPIAGGLVGVGGEMTWSKPVRPGDVLRVVSEVLEAAPSRSKPDRGIVTLRQETLNQRDEPVQVAVMKLLIPRKAAPLEGDSG